ncbi:MAG TPA: hypothetical protein VF280_19165 [Burkholderiales bacterium]
MTRLAGIAWKVLAVAGILAYQVLVHVGMLGNLERPMSALLAAPMVALAAWILLRSKERGLWLLIIGAAAALTFSLGQSGAALYGVPHAAAYLSLLWFFGRTLVRGREAFITRLARHARGGVLPPGMESYTRRLTFAWCVFFAAQLAVSALLLRFGALESWSLFINVLNFPLLALMFAVDYLYRVLRFGDSPASLASAVRAYAKDRASSLLTR